MIPQWFPCWISLSGTALLIVSHVNTLSSPTVAVCIISCLCSRFQPALSIHPSNSELDNFCHLVRDFDTFLGLIFLSIKMFCSARSKHFSLFPPPPPFSFLLLKRNPFPLPNILGASKLGRMPACGETGDEIKHQQLWEWPTTYGIFGNYPIYIM